MQVPDLQSALNHAMNLHRSGRHAEAEGLYVEILRLSPDSHDVRHLLGLAQFDLGRREEGVRLMEEALAANPGAGHYYNNFGSRLIDKGDLAKAEQVLRQGAERSPDCPSTRYNLGNALYRQRKWAEAVEAYRAALALKPDFDLCDLQLGMALHGGGWRKEALAHYRAALDRRPKDYGIWVNYGALLQSESDLDGAIDAFRKAAELMPDDATSLNNLAVALKDRGDGAEAVRLLRRCTTLRPASADISSNLILTMHYVPEVTDAELAEAHRDWNVRHGAKRPPAPWPNDRDPERRLRIGYVSADFRDHVVGRALLPAFLAHDREKFEVFAYAVGTPDAVTEKFRSRADAWRAIETLSEDALERQVREDRIDVLVDLGLHTSDNRLTLFARRPAPVQASWLGLPETSGVEGIGWRISDRLLEPAEPNGLAPHERAWTLPHCWTCVQPAADAPDPGPPPMLSLGRPTFASFNNFCKISDRTLDLWARILKATPGSRLLLLAKAGAHHRRTKELMERNGVAAARVEFLDYLPPTEDVKQAALLARYLRVDVALDTSPFNGMTTTMDALWMGVPVVSLVTGRSLGRGALSLLTNVGLAYFAVRDEEAYVAKAVSTAEDPERLAEIRSGLRPRMAASPLCDIPAFTRDLEAAYRGMWREWCRSSQP
ncbi:MAG: tetratricopeptide repeat protein [Verrucomicrobiota bacterium]